MSDKAGVADHHSVYVVYLRNPKGDGRAAYYVGMTGLTPAAALQEPQEQDQSGAGRQKNLACAFVPKLYAHLNPMPVQESRKNGSLPGREPAQARV